jgi:putative peptidoglycan lipid II flippase
MIDRGYAKRTLVPPRARFSDKANEDHSLKLKRIGTNSLILVALTLVGQVTGLAREATTAYYLGATGRADAYIAAFQPIDIVTSALILAVPFGLIPFLVSYRRRFGEAGSHWAIDRVQLGTACCFLVISLFLYRSSEWIVHLTNPRLSGAQLEQAIQLWHWMLPVLPMVSLTAFFIAQLIAEDRFFFPGANSIFLNLSIVIAPVLGWKLLGIKAFALGVLLGFFLQLVMQGWAVLSHHRHRHSRIEGATPLLWRDATIMIVPVVLLYTLGGLNTLIPRRFASDLGEGNLAIFTYAMRAALPIYLLGVFAISYPYFSIFTRAVASGETDQASRLLRSMLRSVFLFALPAMSAIIVLRQPLVRILFFRGAFDATAAGSVATTLVFLAPFVLGALLADLLGRCLIAMGRTLVACGLYGVMLGLSWVLMRGLHGFGGLKGVSAAWAFSLYAVAALFLVVVNHYLRGQAFEGISRSLWRAVVSGTAAAAIMAISSYCLTLWFGSGMMVSLGNILLTIFAGGVVLISLARRLGVSEVMFLVDATQAAGSRLRIWSYGRSTVPFVSGIDQD